MESDAARQDLRHVSPFRSGSGRRPVIKLLLQAQPGAFDHPHSCGTAEPVLVGAEENLFMGDRWIISDNREDLGHPHVLDGEAIDVAARDPLAIGKL
jgi:hypothetical protein